MRKVFSATMLVLAFFLPSAVAMPSYLAAGMAMTPAAVLPADYTDSTGTHGTDGTGNAAILGDTQATLPSPTGEVDLLVPFVPNVAGPSDEKTTADALATVSRARKTKTPTATPSPSPAITPTPTAPITPSPTATFTATASPTPKAGARVWGLINNDGAHLEAEWNAGIRAKMVSLSWRDYLPAENAVNADYIRRKQVEFQTLRQLGFQLILSTGLHDVPPWVHVAYPNTRYVNQFGEAYNLQNTYDLGEANAVFNPRVRDLMAGYLARVFADFGTDFYAVRLGGGRYGELTYPPAVYGSTNNAYWAFDANAQAQSPVPGWRPGQPSPNGEAGKFLDWYLGALTEYQNWQVRAARQFYPGRLMMLYPSWGIRPSQANAAIGVNLNGTTSAEKNGEIQRGFDFARQVAALSDPLAVVTTTWLDANNSQDGGTDQRYWSPVKYLAYLANQHPLRLALYGENTGQGSLVEMELSAAQTVRFGLDGMAWFNERELFSGTYATLADYQKVIAANGG